MSYRYTRPTMSSGLGCEFVCFSFATGASDSVVRDAHGNTVASVTRTAPGKYTVKLEKPYPRQLIAVSDPAVRQPAGTVNKAHCNVMSDTGWDAALGEIKLEVIVDDGTPAIEDPAAGSRVEFIGYFRSFNVYSLEA